MPGVGAADAAAAAGRGHERLDVGVGAHDLGHRLLVLDHRLEGDPLAASVLAEDLAGVLGGDEPLGHDHGTARPVAPVIAAGSRDHHAVGAAATSAGRPRRAAACRRRSARRAGRARRARILARRPQEAAGHHRRQGQRDEARDQHRDADGDRELAEQPADDAAHEQHRDEDRGQRERHRDDGEADLLRARRAPPASGASPISMWRTMFSSMTMASSTTKPTDSVSAISDRLSRRVAEQVHHREGADDRHRHRQRRDDGRRQVAQEQEDHQHHQDQGEEQGELDVVDRLADRDRAVEEHVQRHRWPAAAARKVGSSSLHRRRDLDRVGAGLALDRQHDRPLVDEPGGGLVVLDAVDTPSRSPRAAPACRSGRRRSAAGTSAAAVSWPSACDGEGACRARRGCRWAG